MARTPHLSPYAPTRSPSPRQTSPRDCARSVRQASFDWAQDKPEPRPGRRRARSVLLLPVLALLLGALNAGPAAADVLVSNMGKLGTPSRHFSDVAYTQRFTTGSHAAGYNLENIEVNMGVDGMEPLTQSEKNTVGAALWSAGNQGRPDKQLVVLRAPSSITTGVVAFVAPANTVLAATTTYNLVVFTTGPLSKLKVAFTAENGEDPMPASGWTIADDSHYIQENTPLENSQEPWRFLTDPIKIRVNGTAVQPPAELTLTTSATNNTAAEDAGTVTVTATLDQPALAGGVAVSLAAGTTSTATATDDYTLPSAFTIAKGDTAATADVTIVDDDVDEDNEILVLTTTVAGLAVTDATLTITDNDAAGVTVSKPSLRVVEGSTGTYTVVLDTKPSANVTITPTSSGTDVATVSGALTFTPSNWNTARPVTVTAKQDSDAIDESVNISHTAESTDTQYAGNRVSIDGVVVHVIDDEVAAPSFDPANGTTTTNAGTNITLTFAEAIRKDGSETEFTGHADLASILTLRRTDANGAAIGYTAGINTAKTVITIDPTSDLADGPVYVAISNGYYDGNGNQGTPASATFTVDATGPAAPTFDPADGTTTTNAGTNITLTFAEAVRKDGSGTEFTGHADLASILTLRQTDANGAAIGYTAGINTAKTAITIDPTSDLADGPVYVAISDGYYDGAGNRGGTASATFTVDATGVAAPTFEPAHGTTTTNAGTNVTLIFAEAVKADRSRTDFTDSTIDNILTLKADGSNGADIGFDATIDNAKKVITIDPTSDFADGPVYVAISNGYYDGNGNQGTPASATFTVDATGPVAPAFDPADGTTTTNAGTNITLTFAEAVKRTSGGTEFTGHADLASILTLRRTDADGADIGFDATINTAKTAITIDPTSDLADGPVYVAISNGYYDGAGNRGEPASATFTVDATGVTAPAFDPADGTTTTNAGTNITLTFAEAVRKDGSGTEFTGHADLASILTLRRTDADGADIGFDATIDNAKKVITIDPTSDFADGPVYVAISNGYYDGNGNQGTPASATFTVDATGAATPTVSLSAAPNPVTEGSPVTVTAMLSAVLANEVTIPLTLTDTAEESDYGALTGITIGAGSTTGTGVIATNQDDDTDDETFTVALGTLPSDVTAGSPSSVQITIRDDDTSTIPVDDTWSTTLTLRVANATVAEDAGAATVTATLDRPAGEGGVAVMLKADRASTATMGDDCRLPVAFTIREGETSATADVTIVDDDVDENNETLVLTATAGNLTVASATLIIADDDTAGVTVSKASLRVAVGATTNYTVVLDSKPTHDVTVTPTSSATDKATTSETLTFTPADWNVAKTVTVTGVAAGGCTVSHRTVSTDGKYSGTLSIDSVAVTVTAALLDPVARAWLSRFGRTVATHVTDAVGDRLRGAPEQGSHLTVGGYQVPLGTSQEQESGTDTEPDAWPNDAPAGSPAAVLLHGLAGVLGLGPGAAPTDSSGQNRPDPRLRQSQILQVDLRQILQGSSFRLALTGADSETATPRLTAWGRVSGTTFDGREGKLTLDGDVFTGTVGLDRAWDRWLVGVAVAHSQGDGGYDRLLAVGSARGDLDQTLTSLHPYVRYAVTDRLDVWGVVGYGWGDWDVAQATGTTYQTDTQLVMGAFGGRGILLAPADTGGVQLATRTDAMFTRTSTDAVPGLPATDADAHRLRLVLEGSRGVTWADGRTFTPTVELGVRHDWGDAETGLGLEVGGRVAYADPALGLTVEGAVRGLVAHEDDAYQEWGASGTVRLAPGPAGQGLALTLAPTWGTAASGVDGLWARQTTAGLAPQTHQAAPAGQLAADVGYGVPLFRTGLLTPYAGTVLADGAARTYRVGTRWASVTGLAVHLEGTRQEPMRQPVNQGVQVQVQWGF